MIFAQNMSHNEAKIIMIGESCIRWRSVSVTEALLLFLLLAVENVQGSLVPTSGPTPSFPPTVTGATTFAPTSFPSLQSSSGGASLPPSPSSTTTTTPSSSPTFSLQSHVLTCTMSLSPWTSSYVMTGQNIIAWESVTANHIRKHIVLQGEIEPEILTLQVETNIVGQTLPNNDNAAQSSGKRSSLSGLIVQFDVVVTYRSVGTDHDIGSLVCGAWDTDIDREDYIRTLLDQSNGLGQITDVVVEVEGFVPPEDPKKGNKVAVIIGAAVGGAAFIFLVAFYLLRRYSRDEEEEQRSHHRGDATTASMTTRDTTRT
jgi:hypothetical protein